MKRIISILLVCLMLTSVAYAGNTTALEYTAVTEDGVTTVTATALANDAAENVSLYTAVYNADGSFAGAKKASSNNSALLKNSVTLGEGQTIKSFTWEGTQNTPVEAVATYGKNFTEADVEITFDGVSFEDYVGSALAFDAQDNVAEYTVKLDQSKIGPDGNITLPRPEVKVKDNTIYYVVDIDEEYLTATIKLMTGRTVTYDDGYKKMSKETYAPVRMETIVINYEPTMFTEDMIVKQKFGEVDFNGNETPYDNIYTYQFAAAQQKSDAIEGKTAVLSALSVDGVAVEGFSPDVFEYNVTVNPAQVAMPKVTYVIAGSAEATKQDYYAYPGKTVVTVTEAGTTNNYTINYVFPDVRATVTSYHSSLDGSDANKKPAYSPDYQVGSRAFTDRSYKMTTIADDLLGVDRIETAFGWEKDTSNTTYYPAFVAKNITDWFTFTTVRGATVMVLDDANAKTYLKAEDGWSVESSTDNPYATVYISATATLEYTYKHSKHINAGQSISIPGYYVGSRGYTVLIKYDDWSVSATDITLTADKFSKSTIVVLVPKDKSEDALVIKGTDGKYSPVAWTQSSTASTEAYDYEKDDEGNVVYTGFDASRATVDRYNSDAVSMTAFPITKTAATGDPATVTEYTFRKLTSNDGHYVYGSRVAANRYPNSSNRMAVHNIPEEYEGSNGIVYNFNSLGHANVTMDFSVNDNLDKIVIMSIDAIPNLKANGEEVFAHSVPATEDTALYTYQGITSGKPAMAAFTMSYHLAKGNMYAHDISCETSQTVNEGYTYYINRRSVADFLKKNTYGPDPEKMSEELYKLATTSVRDGWKDHVWFLGDIGFEAKEELVTNLTFVGPETHTRILSTGEEETHTTPLPKIMDFTVAAYSDRVDNVTSPTGNKAGEPLSYPAWLEVDKTTYISGAYEWTSLPGCSTGFESTSSVMDWYTFTVTEDACVMYFTGNVPANFWATEAEGWKKVALEGDDMINVCRTKTGDSLFAYNNLYVKDVKAGETVTIKSAMIRAHIPLVFVKPAK